MDNIKKLVPIVLGISYTKFARELQVAKVTLTQLNAFIEAVKEDESISVSKQGLLAFVKGKKKEKTDTIIITDEGGQEETKDGGEDTPKGKIVASLMVKDVMVQIIDNEGVREVKTDATPQQVKNALSTFKTMIEALPTKVLSK